MTRTMKIVTGVSAGLAGAAGAGMVTLLLTAGSDPEPAAQPAPADPVKVVEGTPQPMPSIPEPLGDCDQLAGLTTTEVVQVGLCTTGDGGQEILMSAGLDCADGRTLHWNDHGWGYSDGRWQAHQRADGQLVPPEEEMAGC